MGGPAMKRFLFGLCFVGTGILIALHCFLVIDDVWLICDVAMLSVLCFAIGLAAWIVNGKDVDEDRRPWDTPVTPQETLAEILKNERPAAPMRLVGHRGDRRLFTMAPCRYDEPFELCDIAYLSENGERAARKPCIRYPRPLGIVVEMKWEFGGLEELTIEGPNMSKVLQDISGPSIEIPCALGEEFKEGEAAYYDDHGRATHGPGLPVKTLVELLKENVDMPIRIVQCKSPDGVPLSIDVERSDGKKEHYDINHFGEVVRREETDNKL